MTDITDTVYDEKELQALQQAYDQKTKARRGPLIKTQKPLHKQSQLIGSLEEERRSPKEELEGVSYALERKQLLSQSQRYNDIDKSIRQKKETITELQKEINEMHRKIAAMDEDQTKKEQRLTQQQIQATKKLNITAENVQLRHDIESLVIEKEKFLQRSSKLEKAIQEADLELGRELQKISKSDLIREETEAQRVRKLEQACSDEDTCATKIQKLQRQTDHGDKLAYFLQQKNNPRQPNLNYCSTAEKRGAHQQELQQEQLKEYETDMEKINDIVQGRQRRSERKESGSEDFDSYGAISKYILEIRRQEHSPRE
ncbi:apical junction molecule isoform X2 [Astyanax mexicanus]|uniref:apical junction molecule isoform X2 n=1 Tax=Astyanax mexicanus TaxID=7994 RepID=UPI0020CB565C|nr:apical junction molecule isoform X2 [Astyanax mexicanus]